MKARDMASGYGSLDHPDPEAGDRGDTDREQEVKHESPFPVSEEVLFDGSISDSGMAERAKFKINATKRSRRLWHLKPSDRSKLRGPKEDGLRKHFDIPEAHRDKFYRVAAYCTCETYDISEIIEHLENRVGFDGQLSLYTDVIHIEFKNKQRDIFLFSYGATTFFNFTQESESAFLKSLAEFETGSLATREEEELEFTYGSKWRVANDEITLETADPLEKLSVSFALAQCCKLSVFEERIQQKIEENKALPESLAQTGEIGISQKEITMKLGQLFIERNQVNLQSDLLDHPEFFWEQDQFKPIYDRLFQYLELGKRVEILNKRLDLLKELFDILTNASNHLHSSKLEVTVIVLIIIEVLISVFWNILVKDVLRWF